MKTWWISGSAVLALGGAAAMATPSYTAVFLPSAGRSVTYATGITGNQQVIGYSGGNTADALVWDSAYSTPSVLDPAGAVNSAIFATDGSVYVGQSSGPTQDDQAAMWQDDNATGYVNLNPPGYNTSEAMGVAGGQEVGFGFQTSGGPRALLWTGISSAAIDLTPPGYQTSVALGTDGTNQVGYGTTTINGQPGERMALLWNGTALSAINITPAGYLEAVAIGVSGNLVVGSGSPGTGQQDALLWNISNGAYTDLGPGQANAVAGNYEAGYEGNDAMVWTGAADSAIDLQSFLPAGYAYSVAYGVDAQGDVVGAAGSYGQWQAVVWLVPEPTVASGVILLIVASARRRRSTC